MPKFCLGAFRNVLPCSLVVLLGLTGCAIKPTSTGFAVVQDNDLILGKVVREYNLPDGGTATLRKGAQHRHYSLRLNSYFRVAELGRFDLALPEFDTLGTGAHGGKSLLVVLRTNNPGCETNYLIIDVRDGDAFTRSVGNCRDPLVFSSPEGRELQIRDPLGRIYVYTLGRLEGPFPPAKSPTGVPGPGAQGAAPLEERPREPQAATSRKSVKPSAPTAPVSPPVFKSVDFGKAETRSVQEGD